MVALALPATCIGPQTCYSLQQATYTLYEICRACLLFGVDEIIIYNVPEEGPKPDAEANAPKKVTFGDTDDAINSANTKAGPSWEAVTAANILQYFVTPPHLRKLLFGSLKVFHYARKLPRAPGLREPSSKLVDGLAIKKHTIKKKGKKTKSEKADARVTAFVNLGFDTVFELEQQVPVNSRVTIDTATKKPVEAAPQGYTVRAVENFSQIFTETSVTDGYSHTIFVPSQQFLGKQPAPLIQEMSNSAASEASRPLLVFGRWPEVESAVRADPALDVAAHELFDGMLLGSEKARLEDAVMITLARR